MILFNKSCFLELLMLLIYMNPSKCLMSSVFVRTIGQELIGNDYMKFPVKNKHYCLAYCQRDPSCFSVNVAVSDIISDGYGLCTLNNKDDFDRPDQMIVDSGINYYRKVGVSFLYEVNHIITPKIILPT